MADFASALWNKPTSGDTGEGSGGASDPVTRSLRFNGPASSSSSTASETCNLKRTFSSAGNRKTYTVAFWVKRSSISNSKQTLFSSGGSGDSNTNEITFRDNDTLEFYLYPSTSMSRLATAAKFRDVSAWYHVTVAVDTTQATAANRVKMFVNGVQQTFETHTTYPDQNDQSHFNDSKQHKFGEEQHRNRYNAEVLLADCYFIDGSAIEPVGNFIESTGYSSYKPKAFDMSSYSGNSFHIDAQPAHDAELLISSVDRNDGDTTFVDVAAGHTVTSFGDPEHSTTVGNPFDSSGTAISFDGTGDYLSVATSSDFDFGSGSYTYEGWFYFNGFSETPDGIFSRGDAGNTSNEGWGVCTNSSGTLQFYETVNDSYNTSSFTFSTGQWYHIALCKNGTTYKVYVDGSEKISATLSSPPDNARPIILGRFYDDHNGYYLDGYCFDFRAQKGVDTGGSKPSAPLELNPIYIGGDQSGNKNHFAPTNISSHDILLDTPTKNYATLNPLQKAGTNGSDPTEGNLSLTGGSLPSKAFSSTISVNSGKYYAEFYLESYGYPTVSVADVSMWVDGYGTGHAGRVEGNGVITYDIRSNGGSGDYYVNSTSATSGVGITAGAGDIIQVAFDADTRKVWFGRNGTWNGSGDPEDGTNHIGVVNGTDALTFLLRSEVSSGSGTTVANYGQDPTFEGNKTSGQDTSQSEFYYAPPTGFKSLNTSNLDTPTVTPSENFNTILWQGNSTNNRDITGLDFNPTGGVLTWIKNRSDSGAWNVLFDSVRGAGNQLATNETDSELASASNVGGKVSQWNTDGFRLASGSGSTPYKSVNESSDNYVAWNWKESASAGFDIVTYEGDSDTEDDTQDISHGLGVAPEMIIIKARDGRAYNDYYAEDHWYVWHKGLTSGSSINLNNSAAEVDYSEYSTEPISSVNSSTFTVCNSVEYENYYYDFTNWGDPSGYYTGDNERYVAYLFSGVEGYSKFGKYEGNNSADGPFIYCGFRPKFFMYKQSTGSTNWVIVDAERETYNTVDLGLFPNLSTNEQAGSSSNYKMDFLSNGVKIRTSASGTNANNQTFIFAAFAESPFKHANAR